MMKFNLILSILFLALFSCASNNLKINDSADKSSYFPEETEYGKSFSYHLRKLNEPKIFEIKDKNIEIYRLTSQGFGSGTTVLRLTKQGDKINLTSIDSFKNTKKRDRKISPEKFNQFKEKLQSFDVDKFETYLQNPVDDGVQYCFEMYDKGNYKVIIRNNPQTGKYQDTKFLEIADLFYKLKNSN